MRGRKHPIPAVMEEGDAGRLPAAYWTLVLSEQSVSIFSFLRRQGGHCLLAWRKLFYHYW
jgi:hypothetical protein